jgi:Secretion system C-terminal sorting domain
MIQLTFRSGFATASNVRIFNALGQLVHEARSNDMVQQIDLSNLSSGSYTVQVMNNGSMLFKQTFIK